MSWPQSHAHRPATADLSARGGEVVQTIVELAPGQVFQRSRTTEVDRRFADLGLGLVDGLIVALAESLDIRRLATRDVRRSPQFASEMAGRSTW